MSQQLHQQANALLYQALEQPAPNRPAFLKQACGGSRALHELVNSMLSHIDQLDAFLEDRLALPTTDAPAAQWPQSGDTIGNWRVVRELNRGTLGKFMLVERADGARAPAAALRIVDAEAFGLEELALFHRQRELVAHLAHPNIAPVIDSGTVPDGRPYFVVHNSDGVALAEFCSATGLSPRERIALFLPVCQAVHYAHQHMVLHRHLEATSIVVDRDGLVKVTDFGIAGLLGKSGRAGEVATTATDIEGLGKILAALMADRPGTLRGDLAAIVARTQAGAPHETRYASADELARDLHRFSERRSLARNESLTDRLSKSARRHPLAAALTLCAVLGVAATSAVGLHRLATDTAWQKRAYELAGIEPQAPVKYRSRGARGAARFVAGSVVSLADRRDQAEALYVRGHLGNLNEAIDAWNVLALAAEEKNMLDIQTVSLDRLVRLRHIAGDTAGAYATAQELLGVLDGILKAVPEQPAWRARQANALQALGAVAVDQGASAEAVAALRRALAIREELAGEEPSIGATLDIAAARVALADGLAGSGDYASAETEYRLAREVFAAQASDGDAQAKVWEIDLARANVQYLRKHAKTAAGTARALVASSDGAASELVQAKATLMQALIESAKESGNSAGQAYVDAQRALPVLLAAAERDPDDALSLRDSALAWRRVGEIGLRAEKKVSACGYLTLADSRYAELEATHRLAATARKGREEVQRLREGCE